jgi:hypothetical protein
MSKIRIGSKVDEATWNKLKALAADTRRNISDLLTEAIRKYITRKRARPVALNHLELSIAENETPANALPGERVAFLRQNEVLAIHCTLLECLGDHAKKKRGSAQLARTPVSGLFQTALVERLNKRMAYLRSKRSFCITLVHAATKSLTNLSCASSAA